MYDQISTTLFSASPSAISLSPVVRLPFIKTPEAAPSGEEVNVKFALGIVPVEGIPVTLADKPTIVTFIPNVPLEFA